MNISSKLNKPKVARILGGALGLLLALSLVLVPATPVAALPPPGHYFYGDVTSDGEPVAEGIEITAEVAGLEYSTTVDAEGKYGWSPNEFSIPGDDPAEPGIDGASAGDPIVFYINGVRATLYDVEAGEPLDSYLWESGGTTELDLNLVSGVTYALTMAAEPVIGGTATDVTNASPYAEGASVSIKAEAAALYQFVNWTAPAGTFLDADAAETTFTMPGEAATVTANFELIPPTYALTMAAAPVEGGTATDVTNASPYAEGASVSIKAEAAALYQFVNWTAPAGTFLAASEAETTFTMPGEAATVTANFELIPTYALTMAAAPVEGGTATDVTNASPYAEGASVSIKAEAAALYQFVNWTSDPAGTFLDADAAETTFTMPGEAATVTANFELIPPTYALTMAAAPVIGGTATDVTNASPYAEGASVSIKAEAAALYQFVNWTSDPAGTFLAASEAETTFTMPGEAATVTANFEAMPPPVAGFSASPLSGDEPLTVVFTDESLNMADSPTWSWDFGDEETSTDQNPTHQYLQDGSYTVTLTVTTDAGTDDEVKANYIVVANIVPVASFTAEPTSGDYPLEVSFTDTSTSYDGITSWQWDFSYQEELGFNPESTVQHPVYIYQTEGIHTVALIVIEADWNSNMKVAEDLITVTAPDTTPPTVVSTTPEDGAANQAIDVVVSAAFDEDVTTVDLSGITIDGVSVSATLDEATGTITIAHDDFAYETAYTVTIPAGAVEDLATVPNANEEYTWSFTTEAEGPISFITPLSAGWNLLSTPIKLDADSDTLEQILGVSLANIEVSYRWDAWNQQWLQVDSAFKFLPLYAIYLKVSSGSSATAEFIPSEELSGPPSRVLEPGLNLIGFAPALEEGAFPDMPLDQALISIAESEGGLRGYTMVISPGLNQTAWAYALGGEIKDLLPYKGYWVVMENVDTLYGFSTTPTP